MVNQSLDHYCPQTLEVAKGLKDYDARTFTGTLAATNTQYFPHSSKRVVTYPTSPSLEAAWLEAYLADETERSS